MSGQSENHHQSEGPALVIWAKWIWSLVVQEGGVIRNAPFISTTAFIFTLLITGSFWHWYYNDVVSTQATTITSKQLLIEDYEKQLGVKSPREAYEKLENLQGIISAQNKYSADTYTDFVEIVKANPWLGKPLDTFKHTDFAKETIYQKAWVLWINSLSRFYVLPLNTGVGIVYNDAKWDTWCVDEGQLNKHFNPPRGFLRPNGGIACLWKDNNLEKVVGWRKEEDCLIENGNIIYQIFENGIIIGRFHKNRMIDVGEYVVIPNNKSWFTVTSSMSAAKCKD